MTLRHLLSSYLPCHCGARFSADARIPSRASALAMTTLPSAPGHQQHVAAPFNQHAVAAGVRHLSCHGTRHRVLTFLV
jgi:hypothetical protein